MVRTIVIVHISRWSLSVLLSSMGIAMQYCFIGKKDHFQMSTEKIKSKAYSEYQ